MLTKTEINSQIREYWLRMIKAMHMPEGDEKIKEVSRCASRILRLVNELPCDSLPIRVD